SYYTYRPCLFHSFPTRRSSDLVGLITVVLPMDEPRHDRLRQRRGGGQRMMRPVCNGCRQRLNESKHGRVRIRQQLSLAVGKQARSEEHTSELQSRFDLVCRLLL